MCVSERTSGWAICRTWPSDHENWMKVIDAGVTSVKVWVKQKWDPAVEVTELQLASGSALIQHQCERGWCDVYSLGEDEVESLVSNNQQLDTCRMMQTNECAFIAREPQGIIITLCACVSTKYQPHWLISLANRLDKLRLCFAWALKFEDFCALILLQADSIPWLISFFSRGCAVSCSEFPSLILTPDLNSMLCPF